MDEDKFLEKWDNIIGIERRVATHMRYALWYNTERKESVRETGGAKSDWNIIVLNKKIMTAGYDGDVTVMGPQ